MFQNSYKADNEKIKPDDATLKHLAYKMKQEKREKPRKRRIVSAVAVAAACVAVVFGASYVLSNFIRFEPGYTLLNTEEAQTDVTYDDLYNLVETMQRNRQIDDSGNYFDGAVPEGSSSGAWDMGGDMGGGEADFSGTNLQVEGVDEADIIKTDGKYIYALTVDDLVIVEVNGAEMKVQSKISREKLSVNAHFGGEITELYLRGDRLILIGQKYRYNVYDGTVMSEATADGVSTHAMIYDVSDHTSPRFVGSVGQSGFHLSTRMVGDVLYVVTNYTIYDQPIRRDTPESYVPMLYNGEDGAPVEASEICVSAAPQGTQYIVLSSYDTTNPEKPLSSKSVFGCGSTIYANAENLLIASWKMQETKLSERETRYSYGTNLIRYALDNGQISDAVFGSVPGSLLSQFSMDEHNGYFRVVTTNESYTETKGGDSSDVWSSASNNDSSNALYVLGQDLKIVGEIENLAPGERVYSVRFDGDVGYFVTFRQVDPLFAVDLSNAAAPTVLSALKIPGFSEYLHPYSDGLLFGFGKDADEETGAVNGLKLSMFNTADLQNVTEQHKLLLEHSWSDVSYNHKAILVSPQRGIIAFPADNSYLIYSYSAEKGFEKLAELRLSEMYYNDTRGLYINDYFYVFSSAGLNVFSMDSFELLSSLQFE